MNLYTKEEGKDYEGIGLSKLEYLKLHKEKKNLNLFIIV